MADVVGRLAAATNARERDAGKLPRLRQAEAQAAAELQRLTLARGELEGAREAYAALRHAALEAKELDTPALVHAALTSYRLGESSTTDLLVTLRSALASQLSRLELFDAAYKARRDLDFTRLEEESFAAIQGESIDYAVMENAERVIVVGLDAGWSDVGSWSSLHAESPSDEQGNAIVGDVTAIDCRNSYLRSDGGLVAAIGLDNIAVVATGDAVLVTDKSSDQAVSEVVKILMADNRREAVQTRRDWRPWGWFETVIEGPRFHVKQLQVDPGRRLSLQMHHHRSEHWVVVEGTATVTRGDETFPLQESESTFIPAGTRHRLANEGGKPLKIIEIQVGTYFGEDDIIRLTDDFGRSDA